ncbi:hypothetical protein ALC56_02185 [Trachymyrmex septentrionalis]|uniref:T-box domain-containing protein n=1 Tax=Trachymyrmex septentrionalis TaxID=34720 RepID=A0A195FU97_9HYME|nr:hypothetical protein ALC56_02185 [Trachymyrmex septentrionalis]
MQSPTSSKCHPTNLAATCRVITSPYKRRKKKGTIREDTGTWPAAARYAVPPSHFKALPSPTRENSRFTASGSDALCPLRDLSREEDTRMSANAWLCQPNSPLLHGVTAELTNRSLWQQFHECNTEMIITKSGRHNNNYSYCRAFEWYNASEWMQLEAQSGLSGATSAFSKLSWCDTLTKWISQKKKRENDLKFFPDKISIEFVAYLLFQEKVIFFSFSF